MHIRSKDMTKTKFTFVTSECGDWQALYIYGILVAEGHSISPRDVLDAISDILPHKVERHEIPNIIAEDGMPENLKDLSNDLLY